MDGISASRWLCKASHKIWKPRRRVYFWHESFILHVKLAELFRVIVFWVKECDIYRGSKHTKTSPTYFQGVKTPNSHVLRPDLWKKYVFRVDIAAQPTGTEHDRTQLFEAICKRYNIQNPTFAQWSDWKVFGCPQPYRHLMGQKFRDISADARFVWFVLKGNNEIWLFDANVNVHRCAIIPTFWVFPVVYQRACIQIIQSEMQQ